MEVGKGREKRDMYPIVNNRNKVKKSVFGLNWLENEFSSL